MLYYVTLNFSFPKLSSAGQVLTVGQIFFLTIMFQISLKLNLELSILGFFWEKISSFSNIKIIKIDVIRLKRHKKLKTQVNNLSFGFLSCNSVAFLAIFILFSSNSGYYFCQEKDVSNCKDKSPRFKDSQKVLMI